MTTIPSAQLTISPKVSKIIVSKNNDDKLINIERNDLSPYNINVDLPFSPIQKNGPRYFADLNKIVEKKNTKTTGSV